jgi:cellulose synthase/poly-beta-1,6-N-acetylglucosamine synthase-like glycosyltransferase
VQGAQLVFELSNLKFVDSLGLVELLSCLRQASPIALAMVQPVAMKMTAGPQACALSIVVIGSKEGSRLERCLLSIIAMKNPKGEVELVYVDSASTDGSAELAAGLGAHVIRVQPRRPTAALGRNAGWRASSGRFVLFLDGDTILDPKFIVDSLADFESDTAIVWGNRREIHPEASMYNRVLDRDCMSPAGIVDYCGGDVLMRRQALEAVGGYDETLIAGEGPEMCRRLRTAGWKILHIDRPMTGHNLAMMKWFQYWRRAMRTGYAYAEVSERFRGSVLPFWEDEARGNRNRAVALSFLTLVSLSISIYQASVLPLILMPGFILLLAVRTAAKAAWKSPDFSTRFLYGLHSHLQQLPIYIGQLQYRLDHHRGRSRGLIEYKDVAR